MKFAAKPINEVEVKASRASSQSKWAGIEKHLKELPRQHVLVIGDLGIDENKSLNSVRYSLRQYLKKQGLLEQFDIGYCEEGLAITRK